MGISYSDNQGTTWTAVTIALAREEVGLDKNHLWIDNSPTSPYEGNLTMPGLPSEVQIITIAYLTVYR